MTKGPATRTCQRHSLRSCGFTLSRLPQRCCPGCLLERLEKVQSLADQRQRELLRLVVSRGRLSVRLAAAEEEIEQLGLRLLQSEAELARARAELRDATRAVPVAA